MFIDEAKINVKAGDGGDGCESRYRTRVDRIGHPDGGPGGDGGDVVFEADYNIHTLLDFQFRRHFRAEPGLNGSSNHKKGARGNSLHIKIPPGTIIKDPAKGHTLRDLVKSGDSVIIARGGHGGRGNSRNHSAEKGAAGEEREVLLELKSIADVGIAGYPNAGKSTLISQISSARPKIANYPFTTKEPVLGVVRIYENDTFVVCDIPGLIEGAHAGKGLGHKFLRHIERTRILVHLIDVSASDGRDPYQDYVSLNKELKLYSRELAQREQVVALNKVDLPQAAENIKKFKKHFRRGRTFLISALTGEGVEGLLKEIHKRLRKTAK